MTSKSSDGCSKKGLKHKKLLLKRGGFLPTLLALIVSSLLPAVVGGIAKLLNDA